MSIRWIIKQDGKTQIMPNPDHDNRSVASAKNHLRKVSRKADAIFRAGGL